jgi:hypothetical protein
MSDADVPKRPDGDTAAQPGSPEAPHTGPDPGVEPGDGQSETVGAPFRDAPAPTRTRTPFVWVAVVVVVALLVGGLLIALAAGVLD